MGCNKCKGLAALCEECRSQATIPTARDAARDLLSKTGWEVSLRVDHPNIIYEMLAVLLETSPVEVEHNLKRGTITIRRKDNGR